MDDRPSDIRPVHPFRGWRECGRAFAPAFVIALVSSVLCWSQGGMSLAVFIGPVLFVTFFLPSLLAGEDGAAGRLSVVVGTALGVCLVWGPAAFDPRLGGRGVVGACSVLIAWILGLSAVILLLRWLRLPGFPASLFTTLIGLSWLTWPVWLSPALAGHDRAVSWLAPLNPILSVNWAVEELGLWSSPMGGANFAYNFLTNLNQDVAYPSSRHLYAIWLAYGLVGGVVFLGLLFRQHRQTPKSPLPPLTD